MTAKESLARNSRAIGRDRRILGKIGLDCVAV